MDNKEDYWNGYLIRFIAGEGCFHINIMDQRNNSWKVKRKTKTNFEIKPLFGMTLSGEDIESLEFIKERFGFGIISDLKRDSNSNTVQQKQIFISGLKNCKKIIELIDKYKFIGKKGKDYLSWKEAVKLIENKEHLTKEDILKIARIRDQMNKVGKTGKPKNYRDYNWFKESLS